jgi:sortase A
MENLEQDTQKAQGHEARRRQKAWAWIQRGFLMIGLALVGFVGAAWLEGYFQSRAALNAFDDPQSGLAQPDENAANREELRDREPAALNETSKPAPSKVSATLAVLEIPKIRLTAPVLDGTDSFTLNHGVGRIPGAARPGEKGNVALAGHRDSYFRGLKDLKEGDPILLKTHAGVDAYAVDQLRIVAPQDLSVLQATESPTLTLVTCYPFYFVGSAPKRFVVTAHLMRGSATGQMDANARSFTQRSNSPEEEQ